MTGNRRPDITENHRTPRVGQCPCKSVDQSLCKSTGTATQFGRAVDDLGMQLVFALSPQAKGRVERTAGTFQDRLITELRLSGATTMEEAKAVLKQFLPRYNRRFRVPPQCSNPEVEPVI